MINPYKEESAIATEIRRVISKLIVAQKEQQLKTIMITSATLGEGKSTVASNLAVVCSRYRNMKTVLVDLDLRRPRIDEVLGLRRRGGVYDILRGQASVTSCLKKMKSGNLRILTSGTFSNVNVSSVLSNGHISELFAELRLYFDIIIVDSPPVIPVSDPLLMRSEIDGALFVVKAGKTQKPVVKRAINLLKDARINVLGIVLNNMNHILPYYYDHKFYDYEYSEKITVQ